MDGLQGDEDEEDREGEREEDKVEKWDSWDNLEGEMSVPSNFTLCLNYKWEKMKIHINRFLVYFINETHRTTPLPTSLALVSPNHNLTLLMKNSTSS